MLHEGSDWMELPLSGSKSELLADKARAHAQCWKTETMQRERASH